MIYDPSQEHLASSIFLQGHQLKETLGTGKLTPFNAVKRLVEHIM